MGNTSALSRSVIFRAIERGDLKVVLLCCRLRIKPKEL
jgi:hypothetical protein